MSSYIDKPKPKPTQPGIPIVVLYAITLASSAFLLFAIQPLYSRMVLPRLGGSPAVWNTCVMWFQTMLLLGYLYSHILSRSFSSRNQVFIHLTVLATAYLALPIHEPADWASPEGSTPIPWLLGKMTVALALPFFGMSTTAPLLQKWFSWASPKVSNPYFLYSASNFGGLLALGCYPILIEPGLGLRAQEIYWSWSYGLLVLLVGCCGLTVLLNRDPGRLKEVAASRIPVAPITKLRWTACAFVPSSLLLGVTLHVTTDIAAVTFLWLLPLGLYTLSFVLVFARRALFRHHWMIAVQTCLLVVLAVLWEWANDGLWGLGLHLATFFVCAMVCHGELARNRPETEYLTEFYLWISVGGLLGSIFTVLVAPAVFNSVLEYPLMLIAACFLRPPKSIQPLRLRWEIVVSVVFLEVFGLMTFSESVRTNFSLILYAALGTTLYLLAGRRVSLAAGLALLLMARPGEPTEGKLLAQERTFYGVYRVRELDNGRFNVLSHGSTVHGIQEMRERDRHRPFLYFHQDGPLGQLFAALDREGRTIQHIGVAGLGIGSIASYKKPDQHLTFFEIDPVMEKLARDPRFFTFLSQFGKKIDVVTGDARLSIAKQPDDRFDLLILDAFSSDAVPIHLMTREAVAVYLQKLRANGLLVFNISNRYVRLAPILGALADDAGLIALNQTFSPTKAQSGAGASASNWIVIGRTAADLEVISTDPRWQRVHGERGRKSILWTDDYADLIRVVVPPDWLRR